MQIKTGQGNIYTIAIIREDHPFTFNYIYTMILSNSQQKNFLLIVGTN